MAEAARKLDIIDSRPAFTQADADALNARFAGVDTLPMLRTLFAEKTLGRIATVSSFGTESAVLLHLVAQADPDVPVIFVDTLKMFPETLAYRDLLVARFGIRDSQTVTPNLEVLAKKDETGLRWSYDPDGCCEIRKVEPLARAKDGLDAWISGRKAFQAANFKDLGGGDLKDTIAAKQFLVASGYVDAKRVGIFGGSYGGFMTLMAIGRAPDEFAAAVQWFGIINWQYAFQARFFSLWA